MKIILKFLIKGYQITLSPFLGNCCRFYPSCSNYALEAVEKHGWLKGFFLSFIRVIKCNPWHKGGVDLP